MDKGGYLKVELRIISSKARMIKIREFIFRRVGKIKMQEENCLKNFNVDQE